MQCTTNFAKEERKTRNAACFTNCLNLSFSSVVCLSVCLCVCLFSFAHHR